MNNINYDIFYRRFGVRRGQHLMMPPMTRLEYLQMPKRALLHYVISNPLIAGPASDDFIFQGITRPIMVGHVVANGDSKGSPRKLPIAIDPLIRKYHLAHKRFRLMRDIHVAGRDENTLVVYNYGFISQMYRYARSYYAGYFKWWNTYSAVWQKAAVLTQDTDRHQFMLYKLPALLPSVQALRAATRFTKEPINVATESLQRRNFIREIWDNIAFKDSKAMAMEDDIVVPVYRTHANLTNNPQVLKAMLSNNVLVRNLQAQRKSIALESDDDTKVKYRYRSTISQKDLKIFNSDEGLNLLELWKWLGPDRDSSMLAKVPFGKLNRINLIFYESGKWFVLNLGLINSWRVATASELADNPNANVKGIEPKQMQLRFLRMLMSLFQVRTTVNAEVTEIVNGIKPEEDAGTDEDLTKLDSSDAEQDEDVSVSDSKGATLKINFVPHTGTKNSSTAATPSDPQPLSVAHPDEDAPTESGDDILHDDELDKKLLADLAELEVISEVVSKEPQEDTPSTNIVTVIHESDTLEKGVMKVCDHLADNGLISGAQYRNFATLAGTFRHITSPDGKTTLAEYIDIPAETLKIPQSTPIVEIPTVLDKSMLKSSLQHFDEHYIKHVMRRDMAAMTMHIQHAGVAVTSYDVERIEDVMGTYDSYAVRLVPVEGVSSTMRFKVPVVNEDGTYFANGVKYSLRKQIGDKRSL